MRLNAQEGWSVVYSGDTRPCEALVQLARGATLLVHEATFDDSLEETARDKAHSTVSQALQIAHAAGVAGVILTHFSARYPDIPLLPEDVRTLCACWPSPALTATACLCVDGIAQVCVCVAYDFLTATPRTLREMRALLPALRVLHSAKKLVDA